MTLLRFRLTGSIDDAAELITALHAVDAVEHVEEVADLMPHMDDEDSSSAGLPDDIGPGVHDIEVDVPNARAARQVHLIAEQLALDRGMSIELLGRV